MFLVCVKFQERFHAFPWHLLFGPRCPAALTLPFQCLLLLSSTYQRIINYYLLLYLCLWTSFQVYDYVLCKCRWVVWNGAFSQPSSMKRNIWEIIFLVGSSQAVQELQLVMVVETFTCVVLHLKTLPRAAGGWRRGLGGALNHMVHTRFKNKPVLTDQINTT